MKQVNQSSDGGSHLAAVSDVEQGVDALRCRRSIGDTHSMDALRARA